MKYEYMLNWWGGCEEKVKSEYGYENYMYFDSKEERDKVKSNIMKFNKFGLAFDTKEGYLTHKNTVVCMNLNYEDKIYYLEYDFGKDYPEDSAKFMFFDGNYSCDCNKSLFIQRDLEEDFPEMGCGDEIKISDFKVEYR